MNFPGQDKEELLEIKQLLKEYRVLRTEQLYRWFSDKDRRVVGNMLSYLRRGGQLVSDPSGSLLALNEPELKKGWMKSGSRPSGCWRDLRAGWSTTPAGNIRSSSFSLWQARNTRSFMYPMETRG